MTNTVRYNIHVFHFVCRRGGKHTHTQAYLHDKHELELPLVLELERFAHRVRVEGNRAKVDPSSGLRYRVGGGSSGNRRSGEEKRSSPVRRKKTFGMSDRSKSQQEQKNTPQSPSPNYAK